VSIRTPTFPVRRGPEEPWEHVLFLFLIAVLIACALVWAAGEASGSWKRLSL